jgi:hypothetical protein
MFPSAHDITPQNLKDCLATISRLLAAGNQILVVSKPGLACMQKLCRAFAGEKKRLLFRFTITARNSEILRFWEPGAPLYAERLACLRYCHERQFATSVSIEPILDMDDVCSMVEELIPHVSDTIWLGKMNKISTRVDRQTFEDERCVRIMRQQQDDSIRALYEQLKDTPGIRWKESIKEIVGLPLADSAGLDI